MRKRLSHLTRIGRRQRLGLSEAKMLGSLLLISAFVAQDQPVIVEGQRPPEEKKICRTERSTGSRVVRQVCKTEAERLKEQQDAKTALGMGNRSNRPPDAFKPSKGD
jgi:hypothetical protein